MKKVAKVQYKEVSGLSEFEVLKVATIEHDNSDLVVKVIYWDDCIATVSARPDGTYKYIHHMLIRDTEDKAEKRALMLIGVFSVYEKPQYFMEAARKEAIEKSTWCPNDLSQKQIDYFTEHVYRAYEEG